MITILETLVKVEMTLPELRVLSRVLNEIQPTEQVQRLSPNEHRVYAEIRDSIGKFLDKR